MPGTSWCITTTQTPAIPREEMKVEHNEALAAAAAAILATIPDSHMRVSTTFAEGYAFCTKEQASTLFDIAVSFVQGQSNNLTNVSIYLFCEDGLLEWRSIP